ncbi:MAG: class I SAM-dependent methyltransferase [Nitratireductor sp.]
MASALPPPRKNPAGRQWRSLDVAGGTGDIAMRIVEASGRTAHVTVLDINGSMLAVGAERGGEVGFRHGSILSRPMPRNPLGDGEFGMLIQLRSELKCAADRQGAWRGIPCLAPYGDCCASNSRKADVPVLDRIYDQWSMNAIPRIGQAVAGDGEPYRYLVESVRKFPNCSGLQ